MSKTKKFLVIRILCFVLSGLLLSSSVIICNQKVLSVEAAGTDELDVVKAVIYLSLCAVGVVTTVSSGGLTAPAFLELLFGGVGLVDTVQDYIEDNGDGTYTIDAELIQAVNEIICNDYIEGQVEPDENGFYNYGAFSYEFKIITSGWWLEYRINATPFQYDVPLVMVINENTCKLYCYREGNLSTTNSFINNFQGNYGTSTFYKNGTYQTEQTLTGTSIAYVNAPMQPYTADGATYQISYSIPFPVFSDLTTAYNAVSSGDYTDAVNYRAKYFETSSRFTGGDYTGGDITITATKLDGLAKKIDELNATVLSVDEKMDAILEYLEEDEDSGDDGGGDSGDDEEEDEEEPKTIIGWLKKINKNLKDILTQVKQIKWLSVADLIDDIIFNVLEIKQDFEPLVQTMSEKFPFSLPWDTVLIFSLLADSPETPYYEIPFVIPSAGINEVLIVDLARFEKLSKISRFLLTLTFLMMLFALTRKIAHWLGNKNS